MMISTKGRYALRMLVDMAEHERENTYVPLKEIAARQEISEKYLESIVKLLVQNNVLIGVRPESVVLHPAHPTALANLFRARVMETSFLGPMVMVRLFSPSLDCQIEAQWPLRHDSKLPEWLQGDVLIELPMQALQPLVAQGKVRLLETSRT